MTPKTLTQFVTKDVLHIDSHERYRRQPKDLEKRAKKAITHTYLEKEPTVKEWLRQLVPTKEGVTQYMQDLFPSATWIGRYNLRWLLGDAIAGKLSPLGLLFTDLANSLARPYYWYCYYSTSDGVCTPRQVKP
jgi:sodium-independent sulfate anion transporter 11